MKVFVSYSHKDEGALDRLRVHLAMPLREGKIETWFDREILAGQDIDEEVARNLDLCDLFLFLASPDSIASNYCYEREMSAALERHHSGNALVVPIIVEPCDWLASPIGKLKALPHDGKPISTWTNENSAYLDVVRELRRIFDGQSVALNKSDLDNRDDSDSVAEPTVAHEYRVKRSFDEIDKADFKESAFEEMRRYFENAVSEINSVDGIKARYKSTSPTCFTCTIVNQVLKDRYADVSTAAFLTVHLGTEKFPLADIYYSYTENSAEGHANGWFNIGQSDYALHLEQSDGFNGSDKVLMARDAAETLWAGILSRAGVSYD